VSINILDYLDYKLFVNDYLRSLPKRGRGQYARFAEVAQTHKVTISQIFRGEKHLGPEQALRVAQFLGLRPAQIRYFVLLVNYARAGSADLQKLYLEQIEAERERNRELSARLSKSRKLSDEERAVFYSTWINSAVRVLSSIPAFNTLDSIARRLNLPRDVVERTIDFLLKSGLCVENGPGFIAPGPQSTYLESKSPLVARHHGNWRVKAMERHPTLNAAEELSYTAPVSLSSSDVKKIREILAQSIERADEIIGPSDCERIFCLNVDWFEVR
jgi:uncharacterized protein (TIGR02147 family)